MIWRIFGRAIRTCRHIDSRDCLRWPIAPTPAYRYNFSVFAHEGPSRKLTSNTVLAGYLAFVAGFVNSGGFILIGTFTSHVTGSVGRLGQNLVSAEPQGAFFAALLIVGFFVGSVVASLILEGTRGNPARAYGFALVIESLLLFGFIVIAGAANLTSKIALDLQAGILCLAMGMQNSMVTRLSGAVIRTTHLTGVVTDLGIETARWLRWHRAKVKAIPALLDRRPPERPARAKLLLLGIIFAAFVSGAVAGAFATMHISRWAMIAPAALTLVAAIVAFFNLGDPGPQHSDLSPSGASFPRARSYEEPAP